jgi:hypothetical protein
MIVRRACAGTPGSKWGSRKSNFLNATLVGPCGQGGPPDRLPMDPPSKPASPDVEPEPDPADESPAGTWSRLLLVSTPFVLLVVLFLLDRWIRG